jgi:hypothetical protein
LFGIYLLPPESRRQHSLARSQSTKGNRTETKKSHDKTKQKETPPMPPFPTPLHPDGEPAWFTPLHNSYLERLLHLSPGAVLELYQSHLVQAAQRMLGKYGDITPRAYEHVVVGIARTPTRGERARPGYGPGNLEDLREGML